MRVFNKTKGLTMKRNRSSESSPVGSCPPHDLVAEASVLGAVLLAPAWLRACRSCGLAEEDFYRERHRTIYRAIIRLDEAHQPIDTLTVAAHLAESRELEEAGGREYVETLVERIPALGNTRAYAAIVHENARRRALINIAYELLDSVAGGVATDKILSRAAISLTDVGSSARRSSVRFTAPATNWSTWRPGL